MQHAHQKGIIHRDLKPSNVLVALYDGKPVPKVIDFGVAKATGQQLTEQDAVHGVSAQWSARWSTWSPEQAELNNLDIDTRADIYSLGVLLYELLTGTTPFGSERACKQAAFLEMLRIDPRGGAAQAEHAAVHVRADLPSHRGQPRAGAGEADAGWCAASWTGS